MAIASLIPPTVRMLFITLFIALLQIVTSFRLNQYSSYHHSILLSKVDSITRLMSNINSINEDIPLDNTVSALSESERKELWKNISNLEKQAVQLLSQGDNRSGDNTEEAYKLFARSISLKNNDPFLKLSAQYSAALEEKDNKKCEKLLVTMKEIGAPPHIKAMIAQIKAQEPADERMLIIAPEEVDTGSTFSDTVTEKIRVKVNSFYDPEKSDPENGKYMFWYKVAICNEGVEPIQIVARMWEIEKCRGEKEVVRGAGVMSSQPIVAPGDVFTYTSACPLKVFPPKGKRVLGSMSGAYTMCKGNMGQHNFTVKISKFNLILPPDEPPSEPKGLETPPQE